MVRGRNGRAVVLGVVALCAGLEGCNADGNGGAVFASPDAAVDTGTGGGTDVGTPVDTGQCARQSDCDDGLACTVDTCVVGGVCQHDTVDSRCPTGQRCVVGRGCTNGQTCTTSADCDDHVACTNDLCAAGGVCQHIRNDSRCMAMQVCSLTLGCVGQGRCGTDADCDPGVYCTLPGTCVAGTCQPGAARDCSTGDPCIAGSCDESSRSCLRRPISPCGSAVTAGTYTVSPAPTYSCGAGALGPVSMLTLTLDAGGVTVTGFPTTLHGAPPTGGMFSATAMENRGTCTWVYTVSGEFGATAGQFNGTWNVVFNDCVNTLACMSTSGFFTAVRH